MIELHSRGLYAASGVRIAAVIALVAVAGLTGCIGQTEFATNIGATRATLNGVGVAEDGPANVYFEYWRASAPIDVFTTPVQAIPDGAAGPVSADVKGLESNTLYAYRLCGQEEGQQPVCAQTRRFVPGQDNVLAWGATVPIVNAPGAPIYFYPIDFEVFGGPPGENDPFGHAFTRREQRVAPLVLGSRTEDWITCVEIDGNRAVVGWYVDLEVPPGAPFDPRPQFAQLYDLGPAGSGKDRFTATYGGVIDRLDPADCSPFTDEQSAEPLQFGDVAIGAAPAPAN